MTTERTFRHRVNALLARLIARVCAGMRGTVDGELAQLRTWRRARRLVAGVAREERSFRAQFAFWRIAWSSPALAAAVFVESRTGEHRRAKAAHWPLVMRRRTPSWDDGALFQQASDAASAVLAAARTQQAASGSALHKALVTAAIDPTFVAVVQRFLREDAHEHNQFPNDACSLALEVRTASIAAGSYAELAALCRDTPASIEEIWQLSSMLARPQR